MCFMYMFHISISTVELKYNLFVNQCVQEYWVGHVYCRIFVVLPFSDNYTIILRWFK